MDHSPGLVYFSHNPKEMEVTPLCSLHKIQPFINYFKSKMEEV